MSLFSLHIRKTRPLGLLSQEPLLVHMVQLRLIIHYFAKASHSDIMLYNTPRITLALATVLLTTFGSCFC
jgi:dihydrodipicolinate synthase/N-acetylneuraminate lyase